MPVITFEQPTWISANASTVVVPLANLTDAGKIAQDLIGKGVDSGAASQLYEITAVNVVGDKITCTMNYQGDLEATGVKISNEESALYSIQGGLKFAVTTNAVYYEGGL